MAEHTSKDMWGILLTRGILAVLFGIAAVFWPAITLTTLVYLFGAFILASGLIGMVSGLINSEDTFWMRLLVIAIGLIETGVGVYLIRHPLVSFKTLILLIGFTLVIRGVFELVGGLFSDDNGATGKMLSLVSGGLAALAGVVVLLQPAASGVAFVWILGLYALLTGPILIAMSLDLKKS